MVNIRKFLIGIGLIPASSSSINTKGELEVLSSDGRLYWHDGTSVNKVVSATSTDTLTNKTIDADGTGNSITNIENADIKAGAAIDASKIADGSVSSTEFQYLDGVTSAIQTQINTKVTGPASATDNAVVRFDSTTGKLVQNSLVTIDDSGNITANNFSGTTTGTNTGDVTLAAVGSSPNANAASLSGQVLNLQPADGTNPGVLTTGTQTIAGTKTFSSTITGTTSGNTTITATNHGVVISGSGNAMTTTAVGATNTVLHGNTGADPTYSAIVNADITNATIDLTTKVTGVLPSANVGLTRTINAQTGTTYTFVLGDGSAAGGNPLVTASNGSAQTYTVPPNSSVAYPVGTQIDVLQLGAGKVTLAQGAGVTINSKGSNKAISAQYVGVSLIKTATDVWSLLGDLIA